MSDEDEHRSEYFTIGSFNPLSHVEGYSGLVQEGRLHKLADPNQQEFQTTLQTTKMSMIHKNEADLESCYEEFADIVEGLPAVLPRKLESSPPTLRSSNGEKGKERLSGAARSNWLNESEVRCVVEYQGRREEAVCRLGNGELVIVDGGCRFRLERITKVKALYESYQRCLWISCDETSRNVLGSGLKFKISIENDSKDDLYLLFSRIVVAKLTLLEYDIDPKQQDSPEVDRFMMAGPLLKKSQFLGRWDERWMVITDRIESFKEEVCTFEMAGIRQVWTRFEVFRDALVVKVRHGMAKTELALPIVNFNAKFCKDNWLYRIYGLVSPAAI